MKELLVDLGIDPKMLFWAFSGSMASIWALQIRSLYLASGSIIVGTVFGTGFASYGAKYSGLDPAGAALVIGFVGMAIGRGLQAVADKWRPTLPGREV